MKKRFTASYKLAAGFVILALLATYGYKFANNLVIGGENLPPIKPGRVNIIGVDTSKGYRIIVQNQLAKMVQGGVEAFRAGDMSEEAAEEDGPNRRYIPIKEMLFALAGDDKALGTFIMKINEIKTDDWASTAKIWKSEDLEKAFGGDKALKGKLESDLNMHLDGSVLDHVNKNSIYSGIIVDFPVTMKVQSDQGPKQRVARVQRWYRPNLIVTITDVNMTKTHKYYTLQDVANQYALEAERLKSGEITKENIVKSIQSMYSPSAVSMLAETPERIINSIVPVINENQINDATETVNQGQKGQLYTLTFNLTDEGVKRIWHYTRDREGSQLLVVVDGVAISAPRIDHGINSANVQINNLEDESLVQDSIEALHEIKTKK